MTSWLSEENHKPSRISVFFVLLMVVELVLAPGSLGYKDRWFHGVYSQHLSLEVKIPKFLFCLQPAHL